MATKTKTFDCVKMKHKGAEKVQREIRGMTREEELAYWAKGTKRLLEEQARLQKNTRVLSRTKSLIRSANGKQI